VGRHAPGHAFAFLQVDREERVGQSVTGTAVDGVLQARERRLAGEVGGRLVRTTPADELEQWIVAQGVSVVLVLVAAGDLQEALAQQERERMADRPTAPVADLLRQRDRHPEAVVGAGEPDEPAIGAELPGVERHRQRRGRQGGERCARIGQERASWGMVSQRINSTIPMRLCSFKPPMNLYE
jgi:hypothetical protein